MTALKGAGAATATPERFPFTVIDQAVHLLDTPAEPWGIQVEVGLTGHLDEERLRTAVGLACAAHPMARARLLPARRTERTWTWEVAPSLDLDPVRVVTCLDEAALARVRDELYSRQVPLVEAPPFRLVLVRRPAGDLILLNANHAAFDGFGCVRLLQSVALHYTGRPDPGPPVPLDQARDVERHLAAPDRRARARRFRMILSKSADLARRPDRLAPDGGQDGPGYGLHTCALTPEQTAQLSVDGGPTINDLLIAALTRAIAGWNEEHGRRPGRVSLIVPVNLRPKEWQADVITNMVLETRVVTGPDDRRDATRLLEAVRAQSERIKQGAGAALMEVIGGWTSIPLWVKQPLTSLLALTGNRLVDTAVISNLGRQSEPPDFGADAGVTESMWFSAPARMPCGLSLGAVSVAGRLHLSFRFRSPVAGPDAAKRFADRFVADLLALAGTEADGA